MPKNRMDVANLNIHLTMKYHDDSTLLNPLPVDVEHPLPQKPDINVYRWFDDGHDDVECGYIVCKQINEHGDQNVVAVSTYLTKGK